MNPQSPESKQFELPTPSIQGESPAAPVSPEISSVTPELNTSAPPLQAASSLASNLALPGAPVQQDDFSAVAGTSATTDQPDEAADQQVIEKEWVVRAKKIIAATRENPREQNKQLSEFKAGYMKKRYNKDIKI